MATAGQVDEYKKRYDAYIAALNEKEKELDRRSAVHRTRYCPQTFGQGA